MLEDKTMNMLILSPGAYSFPDTFMKKDRAGIDSIYTGMPDLEA